MSLPKLDHQIAPRPLEAWYCLVILVVTYICSFIDRAILTTMVEPIQRDLHINDTAIGLMHGFAFSLFYVFLGIPLGYLADRVNRKRLIVVCVLIWSAFTFACGFARSFVTLFLLRIGVGIGEAGLSPASYSLLADYFPPEKRSRAYGVFQLGVFLGSGIAIMLGGVVVGFVGHTEQITLPFIGAVRSWQAVFMIVGAPGVFIALLCATIGNPPRLYKGVKPAAAGWSDFRASLTAVFQHLARNPRLFAMHFVGFAMCGVSTHVSLLWARPLLTREFDMPPSEAAFHVGLGLLCASTLGITVGSALSDRLIKRGHRDGPIYIGLISAGGSLIAALTLPFASSVTTVMMSLSVMLFFSAFPFGAAAAALMTITPEQTRAQISALYLLALNVVGLTFAPVATGLLADYVFTGDDGLGLGMASVAVAGSLIAGGCLLLLFAPFRRALQLEAGAPSPAG